jgi:hypothetical protein
MAVIAWRERRRVPATILWTNSTVLPPPVIPDVPPPEPDAETEVWIRVPRVVADWLRVPRNNR